MAKSQTERSATTGKFVKQTESSKTVTRPASQHVIHGRNGWIVRKSESSRADRTFLTKDEAVGYAKDVAKKQRSEVYVHRKDGTIMEKDSYGPDKSLKD